MKKFILISTGGFLAFYGTITLLLNLLARSSNPPKDYWFLIYPVGALVIGIWMLRYGAKISSGYSVAGSSKFPAILGVQILRVERVGNTRTSITGVGTSGLFTYGSHTSNAWSVLIRNSGNATASVELLFWYQKGGVTSDKVTRREIIEPGETYEMRLKPLGSNNESVVLKRMSVSSESANHFQDLDLKVGTTGTYFSKIKIIVWILIAVVLFAFFRSCNGS